MVIFLNGDPTELATPTSIAGVIGSMRGVPDGRGVAVALDGEVVPRGDWDRTEVTDGAHVEVVVAVQGG